MTSDALFKALAGRDVRRKFPFQVKGLDSIRSPGKTFSRPAARLDGRRAQTKEPASIDAGSRNCAWWKGASQLFTSAAQVFSICFTTLSGIGM